MGVGASRDHSCTAAVIDGIRGQWPIGRRDLQQAMAYIKLHDLREDWVPDVLRYEDQMSHGAALLDDVEQRLSRQSPSPALEIEIPKTPFFSRAGQVLSIGDRIAFQAVVGSFANQADGLLAATVYSARIARRSRYFTRRSQGQWRSFQRAVRNELRSGDKWLIKSDLTSYFDSIRKDFLLDQLAAMNVVEETRVALGAMLDSWSFLPGQGIPQGPNASRIIGNLYLSPIDEAVIAEGVRYFRYMDDVRIISSSKRDVIRAMRTFERECRRRGLNASPAKTWRCTTERMLSRQRKATGR